MQKFVSVAALATAAFAVDTTKDNDITHICQFADTDAECDSAPTRCWTHGENGVNFTYEGVSNSTSATPSVLSATTVVNGATCLTGTAQLGFSGVRGEDDERILFNITKENHVRTQELVLSNIALAGAGSCIPVALVEPMNAKFTPLYYSETTNQGRFYFDSVTCKNAQPTDAEGGRNPAEWYVSGDSVEVVIKYDNVGSKIGSTFKVHYNQFPECTVGTTALKSTAVADNVYPENVITGIVATTADLKISACIDVAAFKFYRLKWFPLSAAPVVKTASWALDFTGALADTVAASTAYPVEATGCLPFPPNSTAGAASTSNLAYLSKGVRGDLTGVTYSAIPWNAVYNAGCSAAYYTGDASTPQKLGAAVTSATNVATVSNGGDSASNLWTRNVPVWRRMITCKTAEEKIAAIPSDGVTYACVSAVHTTSTHNGQPMTIGSYKQALCFNGSVEHEECTTLTGQGNFYVDLGEEANSAAATGVVAAVAAVFVASRF